jgi:nucleoid-associated protein YgaU
MKSLTLIVLALLVAALGCDNPPLEDPIEDHDSLHQCDQPDAEPTPDKTCPDNDSDDGFERIAERVYGDASGADLIREANPGVDPCALEPGQTLVIPPRPNAPGDTDSTSTPTEPVEVVVKEVPATVQPYAGPVEEEPAPSVEADYTTYTVTADDTGGYWGIAQKVYNGEGKYWRLIADANPEVDSSRLRVGMELVIPPLPAGD